MLLEAKTRLEASKEEPAVIKDLARYVTMNLGKFDGPNERGCSYQAYSKKLKGSALFVELVNITKSLEKDGWKPTTTSATSLQAYKKGKVTVDISIHTDVISFDVMVDKPEDFEKV